MWIEYKVLSANWVGSSYGYTAPSYGGIGFGFQVGVNNGNQSTTSSSAQQRNSRSANNARLLNGTWVGNGNVITLVS